MLGTSPPIVSLWFQERQPDSLRRRPPADALDGGGLRECPRGNAPVVRAIQLF